MNSGYANRPGHNLHWFRAAPIVPDISEAAVAAHHYALPTEQRFVGQRLSERPIQVNRHLRDAALRKPDSPFICGKAYLLAGRRRRCSPMSCELLLAGPSTTKIRVWPCRSELPSSPRCGPAGLSWRPAQAARNSATPRRPRLRQRFGP